MIKSLLFMFLQHGNFFLLIPSSSKIISLLICSKANPLRIHLWYTGSLSVLRGSACPSLGPAATLNHNYSPPRCQIRQNQRVYMSSRSPFVIQVRLSTCVSKAKCRMPCLIKSLRICLIFATSSQESWIKELISNTNTTQ